MLVRMRMTVVVAAMAFLVIAFMRVLVHMAIDVTVVVPVSAVMIVTVIVIVSALFALMGAVAAFAAFGGALTEKVWSAHEGIQTEDLVARHGAALLPYKRCQRIHALDGGFDFEKFAFGNKVDLVDDD